MQTRKLNFGGRARFSRGKDGSKMIEPIDSNFGPRISHNFAIPIYENDVKMILPILKVRPYLEKKRGTNQNIGSIKVQLCKI